MLDPVVLRRGTAGRVLPMVLGALATAGFLSLWSVTSAPALSRTLAIGGVLLGLAVVVGAATMTDTILVVDKDFVRPFPEARLRRESAVPAEALVGIVFRSIGLGTAIELVAAGSNSTTVVGGRVSVRQIDRFAQRLEVSGSPLRASVERSFDRD